MALYSNEAGFGRLDISGSMAVTGSFLVSGSSLVYGLFAVSSSNVNQAQPAMQINNEGVFIVGAYTSTPTAVEGGFMYSGSEYFLGF